MKYYGFNVRAYLRMNKKAELSGILWWMLEEELRLISSERGPKTEMLRIIINFINLAHVLFVYSRI